jgi:hypothetical protein
MITSITSNFSILVLAGASLLAGTGCLAHQSADHVVACNARGIAEHDFATTDPATLSRVEGLLMAPSSGGQPSSLTPVRVRFQGTVAYASCQRSDATVAFLLPR